jgi:mRNA interferase RelE/StbE
MASYSLRVKRSAEKEIRGLPADVRRRVITRIQSLVDNAYPPGATKLTGREAWRLRVGAYRIVYTIEDQCLIIEVVRVAHRREVYRK